jgi:hypothetical protein
MKTWKRVKREYPAYLQNNIKVPAERLCALSEIEHYLKEQFPSLIHGYTDFRNIDKSALREKYEAWKGEKITGAESHVFNDFYKLSTTL